MGTLEYLVEKAMQIYACVHACLHDVLIFYKWCSVRVLAPPWRGIQSLKAASGVGMQTWSAGGVLPRLPGTTFLFPPQTEGNVKGWWAEDKPPAFTCSITAPQEAASSRPGGERQNTLPFSKGPLPPPRPAFLQEALRPIRELPRLQDGVQFPGQLPSHVRD